MAKSKEQKAQEKEEKVAKEVQEKLDAEVQEKANAEAQEKEAAEDEVKTGSTKKVVNYGDYLLEARQMLAKSTNGKINGMEAPLDLALALIYERNQNVQPVSIKGQSKFVCDA